MMTCVNIQAASLISSAAILSQVGHYCIGGNSDVFLAAASETEFKVVIAKSVAKWLSRSWGVLGFK